MDRDFVTIARFATVRLDQEAIMLFGFRLLIVAAGVVSGHYPLATLPQGVPVPVTQVYESGLESGAWVAEAQWDDAAEAEFAAFVEALGTAREEKVFRLAEGLRNPHINPLYSPEDKELRFDADCATFAYALRAYFAYKTGRPFSFTANKGRRYRYGNRPERFSDHTRYATFESLLRNAMSAVSTGHFRMHAALEGTDTYPVEISREAIRPGVTFYDPGGHVLVVYRVDRVTGDIYMMDGHPDGTVTLKTFSYRMARGSRRSGGGFRAWRHYDVVPLDRREGSFLFVRELNRDARHFNDMDQFRNEYRVAGKKVSYHEYVKAMMRDDGPLLDPLHGLERRLDRLCLGLQERSRAVRAAQDADWTVAPFDGKTPRKVFWGTSPWHQANTAASDIRLRAQVAELRTFLRQVQEMARLRDPGLRFAGSPAELQAALVSEFERAASRDVCQLSYTSSMGEHRALSLQDALSRVRRFSFDPYHCAERRWGAAADSLELASCVEDDVRIQSYRRQAGLRKRTRMHSRAPAPPKSMQRQSSADGVVRLFGI
jgi:hypothetical protein